MVTPQGTVHYVYDAGTGHLVETWTGTGSSDATSTTETLYGYDDQGRLASVTTARQGGAAVTLTSSVTKRYDAEGQEIDMTQPGNTLQPTTLYLYDGDGNLISQVNPNNTETDYDYTNYWSTSGGEEIVANKRTSDSTPLSQFTYTFDANRNKISELDQMTDAGEGASNSQLYTWAYDADGRLTDETFDNQSDAPDGTTNAVTTDDYHDHYDYDLNGNRVDEKIDTSADGGTGSSAVYDQVTSSRYDARNELTSETQTTVATGTTVYSTRYLYDANGSILSSTRTGSDPAVTTYTYDARNRILTVSSGGSTTTYTYSDDGILVKQAVAGGDTTTYLIDANNPTGYSQVLEVSKNGGSVPTTTYTLGKTIIAQNSGGTISYIMPDGHGSTRQLTAFTTDASNGHVTARYDYDAFGNPIIWTATTHAANTASTSVMYAGMLLDPITGNYRTESREYTPADGRFFWRDSYMPAAGDFGNANLYMYVGGNPLNLKDPTGQMFTTGQLVIAGLALALIATYLLTPISIFTPFHSYSLAPLSSGVTPRRVAIVEGDLGYGMDWQNSFYHVSPDEFADQARKAGHTVFVIKNPNESQFVNILNNNDIVLVLSHGGSEGYDTRNRPECGFSLGGVTTNPLDGGTGAHWITANELSGRIKNPGLIVVSPACDVGATNRLATVIGGKEFVADRFNGNAGTVSDAFKFMSGYLNGVNLTTLNNTWEQANPGAYVVNPDNPDYLH